MTAAPEKVSVIVPVYNVEAYLSSCLVSCMQQTLKDIEIICVNDGSTDHSLEIIKAFQKEDPRIRIIDKENGGLSSARNAGIKAARGEWLVFLDSDDMLSENTCEKIWCEGMEEPTDIVVFGAQAFPWYPAPTTWLMNNLKVQAQRFSGFKPRILFQTNGSIPFVWRQAFKRSLLLENGLLFDEEVRFGEDTVFQLEIFPHASNFAYISDVLYHYRWCRPGSLMAAVNKDYDAKIKKHLFMIEHICGYWEKMGWFDLYGAEYTSWVIDFLVPDTQRPDVQNGKAYLKELYRILDQYKLVPYIRKSSRNARLLLREHKSNDSATRLIGE